MAVIIKVSYIKAGYRQFDIGSTQKFLHTNL